MADELITLRFESSDGDDVIHSEIFDVWRIFDNLDDLEMNYEALLEEDSNDPEFDPYNIIAFVKNLGKTLDTDYSDKSGSTEGSTVETIAKNSGIPPFGGYFKLTEDGWVQVLVGTHSHYNKEFLDEIGNVNEDIINGSKTVVEHYNSDGEVVSSPIVFLGVIPDGNGGFNVKYTDISQLKEVNNTSFVLPEIPEELSNKQVFLSNDNGVLSWKPINQKFDFTKIGYFEIEVTEDNIIEFANTENRFTAEDNFLVVDGQFVIDDFKVRSVSDYIRIESEGFDIGEIIKVLIIRNSTEEVQNDSTSNGLNKSEVEKIVNERVKSSFSENYAKKYHMHYEYAPFQHIHSNYVTKDHLEEELKYILGSELENGEDLLAVLRALQEQLNEHGLVDKDIVTSFLTRYLTQEKLENYLSKYYLTKSATLELIREHTKNGAVKTERFDIQINPEDFVGVEKENGFFIIEKTISNIGPNNKIWVIDSHSDAAIKKGLLPECKLKFTNEINTFVFFFKDEIDSPIQFEGYTIREDAYELVDKEFRVSIGNIENNFFKNLFSGKIILNCGNSVC